MTEHPHRTRLVFDGAHEIEAGLSNGHGSYGAGLDSIFGLAEFQSPVDRRSRQFLFRTATRPHNPVASVILIRLRITDFSRP